MYSLDWYWWNVEWEKETLTILYVYRIASCCSIASHLRFLEISYLAGWCLLYTHIVIKCCGRSVLYIIQEHGYNFASPFVRDIGNFSSGWVLKNFETSFICIEIGVANVRAIKKKRKSTHSVVHIYICVFLPFFIVCVFALFFNLCAAWITLTHTYFNTS